MVMGDGWVNPLNGFKYKLTPEQQSWDKSREICKQWGGDLAVYGIIELGARRYRILVYKQIKIKQKNWKNEHLKRNCAS